MLNRNKVKSQGLANLWWGSAIFILMFFVAVEAEPRLPVDENEVLETLPLNLQANDILTELQQKVARNPDNIQNVVELVTVYIKLGRLESDPRFYSYAKAVLRPWWEQQQPPSEVLLLRATLQQHDHDYDKAKQDLKQLLQQQPHNAQGWLTLATIQLVQADYKNAQSSCSALARTGNSWIATVCYAQLMGLSGSAERGIKLLDSLHRRSSTLDNQLQQWILSLSAELSAQLGQFAEAEVSYQKALAISIRDPYLLKTYSELLLQKGQFNEVLDLLKNETRDDALLLQLTRAAKFIGDGSLLKHYQTMLDLRYQEASLRGSTLHRREEALYRYEVTDDKNTAHQLALANWALQKEPADTLILLQTSIAANDQKSIRRIEQFIEHNGLEDSRIQELLAQLASKTI